MAALRSSLCTFSSLFFQLCFLTVGVFSCGISTHIDIAHQAINWFKDARNNTDYREIILRHQDAFVGGNPYPDAMYSSFCFGGKFHSIAEDTHWAPFLNATVRYIRKKYPKPWDQVSGDQQKSRRVLYIHIPMKFDPFNYAPINGLPQDGGGDPRGI